MQLPVTPPVAPMLAQLASELPAGGDLLFEPKWDGFRCIAFRDGPELQLQSRNSRPLDRYFPELAAPMCAQLPARCVVDGEIVIARGGGLDFEALLQRIHPAGSRIEKLARDTPASFVAFDLLAIDDSDLRPRPLEERRARLEAALGSVRPPLHLCPATRDRALALDWFHRFEGAGLDGVLIKRLDRPYVEGKRDMLKLKHERTADCAVGGFRLHKDGRGVGSLLLGLYDLQGVLQHVGVATGFNAAQRRELLRVVEPLRLESTAGHPWAAGLDAASNAEARRIPGGESRWARGRDASWLPLRPTLVVEVAYDHMQGTRFRHATRFRRPRPDRDPRSCTYEQLETPVVAELGALLPAWS